MSGQLGPVTERERQMGKFLMAFLETLASLERLHVDAVRVGLLANGCTEGQFEEILKTALYSGLVERRGDMLLPTPKGRIIFRAFDAAAARHNDWETIAPANTWLA